MEENVGEHQVKKKTNSNELYEINMKSINDMPIPGKNINVCFDKKDPLSLIAIETCNLAKEENTNVILRLPEKFLYTPPEVLKNKAFLSFIANVEKIESEKKNGTTFVSFKIISSCYATKSNDKTNKCSIIEEFIQKNEDSDTDKFYVETINSLLASLSAYVEEDCTLHDFLVFDYTELDELVNFLAPHLLWLTSQLFHDFITSTSLSDKADIIIAELNSKYRNLKREHDRRNTYIDDVIQKVDKKSEEVDEDDAEDEETDCTKCDNILDSPISAYDEEDEEKKASKEELDSFFTSLFSDEESEKSRKKGGYYEEYVRQHGKSTEIDKYINFLDSLDASTTVKDEIAKEIYHLSHEKRGTADYTTCINWLENVMALPWNVPDSPDFSIDIAKDIIEKSHYGMKDVKERIIEFLAVRKKNNSNDGAIICLVGPPGCGKTSIGKSIANALNKRFTRFSLGSLHDEADIVGHRRTYVASCPGKIMSSIRSAKAKDPVILLDEIDKVAAKQGNPLSALLEVLDPEQNKNFQDVYFDFPFDLSKVLFILTANDLSSLPLPILDRLEIIEVSGYTENEKLHIAKDFLLPKLKEKMGLKNDELYLDDDAILEVIDSYTAEDGVRNLERQLAKIIRKFVLKELTDNTSQEGKTDNNLITKEDIKAYLGTPLIDRNNEIKADKPGSSLGLSKSTIGGDVLRIEVVSTKGTGVLMQTGHLGDVLKESAEVAFTLLKSMYSKEVGADDFFKSNNFHLHLPEGAIQKDGPSAGSALFSAFYSLYKNIVIKPHLAMTGEINLLGEVTAIGGLKDKLLGAKRNHVTDVIVPLSNKKDIDEIDDEIKDGLQIHFVSNINEVIDIAFNNKESEEYEERPRS